MSQETPDPTAWHCARAPGPRGSDNTTHHMVSRPGQAPRCSYCHKTRSQLLGEAYRGECLVCHCKTRLVISTPGSRAGVQCVDAAACFATWRARIAREHPVGLE